MNATAFNNTKVFLIEEKWKHIVLRHLELENKLPLIFDTVTNPDEGYIDPSRAFNT